MVVVVVVVVVEPDLGNVTPSAIIVLTQTLANKIPKPSVILGFCLATLFTFINWGYFVIWGGFGGGIVGGGGNLFTSYLYSISLYKLSSYRPESVETTELFLGTSGGVGGGSRRGICTLS